MRLKPGSFFYNLFFLFANEYESFNGRILPNKSLRTGGEEFQDNEFFVQSAHSEAEKLITHLGLNSSSRLLDIGCGYARLAIGLLDMIGTLSYVGIDVNPKAISWSQKYIGKTNPDYKFVHLNIKNARYNPSGGKLTEHFRFPFEANEFDILYLYSVFSHMVQEDIEFYLKELNRVMAVDGYMYFTAFVEDDVPDMMINPEDYLGGNWQSELHCVRYNLGFFNSLLTENGFKVDKFEYAQETNGQSGFYISKKTNP